MFLSQVVTCRCKLRGTPKIRTMKLSSKSPAMEDSVAQEVKRAWLKRFAAQNGPIPLEAQKPASEDSQLPQSKKRSTDAAETPRKNPKVVVVEDETPFVLINSDRSDDDDDDVQIVGECTLSSAPSTRHRIESPFNPIHNSTYDRVRLPNSYTLKDILGSDQLKTSYLFSYQFDMPWILNQYHNLNHTKVFVTYQEGTLLGGDDGIVEYINVFMKQYTSHHSKLIINEYDDGSVKIWILSCNLHQIEFEMNNQMVWQSPAVKRGKSPKSSQFQNALVAQISNYKKATLRGLVRLLLELDFSPVVGDFIPSATNPNTDQFGHVALYKALKAHNCIPRTFDVHRTILYQSSSIAGPYAHSPKFHDAANIFTHFLAPMCLGAFGADPVPNKMNTSRGEESLRRIEEKTNSESMVVFPSRNCILYSHFGRDSGGWSNYNPHSMRGEDQLSILRPRLYKSESQQRDHNANHTKFIIMTSDNFKTIDWILFTSHNMSKQAWGNPFNTASKSFGINVDNYETGVLITPDHYQGKKLIPVEIGVRYSLKHDEVPIMLPFRVPPPKYSPTDEIWCRTAEQ